MLTLRSSLVEQNHEMGVSISGSEATIDTTVVRATQPRADGTFGRGIELSNDSNTPQRATLVLHASVVEQNHDTGVVLFGSDATIETSVVRTTQPGNGTTGVGIELQEHPETHEHATLTLRSSLVEQNHDAGVSILGSDATIEASIVPPSPAAMRQGMGSRLTRGPTLTSGRI